MRWTTGIGIAVGGTTGAIAALMGSPEREVASPAPAAVPAPASATLKVPAAPRVATPAASAGPGALAPPASGAAGTPASGTEGQASASASLGSQRPPPTAPSTTASPIGPSPALNVPTSREALHKAMLFCDQKKDFDECARVAMALDLGSTGPADPEQAKRFRRIALTHLVAQCEAGSAHACFVLAAKYRAGTELAASAASAEALEKRGLELCRLGRSAPECPAAP